MYARENLNMKGHLKYYQEDESNYPSIVSPYSCAVTLNLSIICELLYGLKNVFTHILSFTFTELCEAGYPISFTNENINVPWFKMCIFILL